MNVTIYKIGFRVDKDGKFNHLWDGGDMVSLKDYERLYSALQKIALGGQAPAMYVKWASEAIYPQPVSEGS